MTVGAAGGGRTGRGALPRAAAPPPCQAPLPSPPHPPPPPQHPHPSPLPLLPHPQPPQRHRQRPRRQPRPSPPPPQRTAARRRHPRAPQTPRRGPLARLRPLPLVGRPQVLPLLRDPRRGRPPAWRPHRVSSGRTKKRATHAVRCHGLPRMHDLPSGPASALPQAAWRSMPRDARQSQCRRRSHAGTQ